MVFEALVKKISPTLRRITYRLNGHYTAFNHDDLYQEAMIHLWDDCKAGKLDDKTDSYILQGCYFHLKNYIRKTKDRSPMVSFEALCGSEDESSSMEEKLLLHNEGKHAVIEYFHNKLLADTIRNNGFSPREKDILGFYSRGLTTREIGRKLGVSHVMVVKITNRIKEKCKKYIDA